MDHPSLLPAAWDVPETFRKRLGKLVGRQRAMSADGHLLLVLHEPPGPEDAGGFERLLNRTELAQFVFLMTGETLSWNAFLRVSESPWLVFW